MSGSKKFQDKVIVKASYDRLADQYDQLIPNTDYVVPAWLEKNLPKKFLSGKALVLDLGCASGNLGLQLHKANNQLELFGIDISKKMIEKAIEKKIYKQLFVHDLDLPLQNLFTQKFDLILSFGVLEFVESLRDRLGEISTLLTRDGTFLCSFQKSDDNSPQARKVNQSGFTHFTYSQDRILEMTEAAQLVCKSIESVKGYTSPSSGQPCPYLLFSGAKV